MAGQQPQPDGTFIAAGRDFGPYSAPGLTSHWTDRSRFGKGSPRCPESPNLACRTGRSRIVNVRSFASQTIGR
jgi:hypothetical protein